MDIGRAFSFPFQDRGWITKIIIGAVMALIPILGWFCLAGYGMRIMRNVVAGSDVPLPEWTDFGQLFVDGIKGWVVGIIWGIPAIILNTLGNTSDSFTLQCIGTLVGILSGILSAAAIVPVAISGNIADGLQFQQIISRVFNNIGDYLLLVVMGIVLGFIAAAGLVACIVGVLVTIAYASFVDAHLWAQAYRRSTGGGRLEPVPRF